MRRRLLLIALTALALVCGVALGACGGDDKPKLTKAQQMAQAAIAARRIAPGVELTYTEKGQPERTGALMAPLKTYAAAKTECGYWHAAYVAKVYGGVVTDRMTPALYDHLAHAFAIRRAAPGDLADVEHGCRAGLHP
jgi:hypothetical protein